MSHAIVAFEPPAGEPRWKRWLLHSGLARIAWFVLFTLAAGLLAGLLLAPFGEPPRGMATGPDASVGAAVRQLLMRAGTALIGYLALVHFIERRRLVELAPRRLVRDSALGLAAGLLLFSTIVGALWLAGAWLPTGTNPQANWLPALLVVGLGAGISEEIMFRGVLFRIVEEGLGTWIALAVSALFFGFAHMGNPGATLWSSVAIAIEAGLLFGMLYHVTRSLALCMGLHAAWNFAQGTIYGIPVSGTPADGWLVSTRHGPDWLSGGAFGAEASVLAIALCTLATLALLWLARRRGSLVAPAWRRR